jgi:formamidopyrimidine-DNA glycosylase
MPELPEVETIVRDLATVLPGRRIESVRTGHPSVFRFPDVRMATRLLRGRSIAAIERRGKYIDCHLDSGDDLVVHLGMTGHLLVTGAKNPQAPHTHLRALLDDGRELRFDDARRFGRILVGDLEMLQDVGKMPALGVEPLSEMHTGAYLRERLHPSKRFLKAALMDQTVVAGLGNIYVDEACHLAKIKPTRRCHLVTRAEFDRLSAAIVAVLRKGIANRGTSFDDYRDVWNAKGSNQESLQVYGRGGEPCFRDGNALLSAVVGGRTTVWCATCQK